MCQEFTKTRFITVPIKQTLEQGIAIGQGKCKAVRLKLNTFFRNTLELVALGTPLQPFLVYYGDSQTQENELFANSTYDTVTGDGIESIICIGDWTPKIYCTNLEEVFIRYGGTEQNPNWPATANVQVMILD